MKNNDRTTDLNIVKTIRISSELADRANEKAAQMGSNFSSFVSKALEFYLKNLPKNYAEIDEFKNAEEILIDAIKVFLDNKYPDKKNFGMDVTLEVFNYIQNNNEIKQLYDNATKGSNELREGLNRNIGKAVKNHLNAVVRGRSNPIHDPCSLIKTYALLEPSK